MFFGILENRFFIMPSAGKLEPLEGKLTEHPKNIIAAVHAINIKHS